MSISIQHRSGSSSVLNANDFAAEMTKIADEHDASVNMVIGVFGAAMHRSVKWGSPITGASGQPVDTARLRESIIMSIGVPQFPNDGAADSPINTNPGSFAGAKMGDVLFIATNLIYAQKQEYEHRTHAGSFRQTVAHAQALLDEIAKRARENPAAAAALRDAA